MTGATPEATGKESRATEPAGEALEMLVTFIAKAFDQRDELKRFVRQLPDGVELATMLPGDVASTANIAYALIASVTSRGLLDADFFALLLKMRPKLGAQINALRRRCLCADEPAGTIAPGVLLRGGRYQLQEMIDHGGVASVWRATDRHNGTQVAIKVLRRDMRDYKLRRWQFIKGAKHFAAISSPRIARIIEPHFTDLGLDFCVLQFVRGQSLAEVLKSQRLATPLAVVDVILDIGSGLEALHPRIFHGDISPKNIIIGDDGHATLVDFDLASDIDELPMTQATGHPGTAPYASPEWRDRRDAIDARTDIFSLGMTAVYALYGGKNLPLGLNDSLVGEPGPFIDKYLICDATIKSVLKRACAFDLTERYSTVQQFCQELRRAALPPAAAVPETPGPPASQQRPVAEHFGQVTTAAKPVPIVPPSQGSTPAEQPAPTRRSPSAPQSSSVQARSPKLEPQRSRPDQPDPHKPAIAVVPDAAERSHLTEPSVVEQYIIEASNPPGGPTTNAPATEPPRKRRSLAVLAGLFVFASGGTIWSLLTREVYDPAEPEPVVTPAATDKGLSEQELALARRAIQNLGLQESETARATLQKLINDPNRSSLAVAEARLLQAELLLMRALGSQLAIRIEPAALDRPLQIHATVDPRYAEDLLRDIGGAVDPEQLRRVRALQALVQGKTPDDLPPGSEELHALVMGAPLWRGEVKSVPAGLLTALQRIPDPSSLCRSMLALALWNSGDPDGARQQLRKIIERIADHPVAGVLLASMSPEKPAPELIPPEKPAPEPIPPEAPQQPSESKSIKAPVKKPLRTIPPAPEAAPASKDDVAFTSAMIIDKIQEQAPSMISRCRSKPSDKDEHAAAHIVAVSVSVRKDGRGLYAAPEHSSDPEKLEEAKCLANLIQKLDLGRLAAIQQTISMKFTL